MRRYKQEKSVGSQIKRVKPFSSAVLPWRAHSAGGSWWALQILRLCKEVDSWPSLPFTCSYYDPEEIVTTPVIADPGHEGTWAGLHIYRCPDPDWLKWNSNSSNSYSQDRISVQVCDFCLICNAIYFISLPYVSKIHLSFLLRMWDQEGGGRKRLLP